MHLCKLQADLHRHSEFRLWWFMLMPPHTPLRLFNHPLLLYWSDLPKPFVIACSIAAQTVQVLVHAPVKTMTSYAHSWGACVNSRRKMTVCMHRILSVRMFIAAKAIFTVAAPWYIARYICVLCAVCAVCKESDHLEITRQCQPFDRGQSCLLGSSLPCKPFWLTDYKAEATMATRFLFHSINRWQTHTRHHHLVVLVVTDAKSLEHSDSCVKCWSWLVHTGRCLIHLKESYVPTLSKHQSTW